MIKAMILAGCGGFIGTCGRFLVGKWASGMYHGAFPMGTFLVNIIGCFIIGLFFGLLERAHVMTPGIHHIPLVCRRHVGTRFKRRLVDFCPLGLSVVLGVLLVWGGRALIR